MGRTGTTRYAVLGALTFGSCSGYDIRRELEDTVGHFWAESFGQIYPVLRQLEREGLILAVEPGTGRPERRVYAITDAGRAALGRWLILAVDRMPPARNETLLKVFFGSRVPPAVTLAHLDRLRWSALDRLATYEAIESRLATLDAADPDRPYWLATVRYGRLHAEATVAWCDATAAQVRSATGTHDRHHDGAAGGAGQPDR